MTSAPLDERVVDRALGALLGLAAGDAVGTTLEFRPRDSYAPLVDMVGGGPFDLTPGVWTDDTAMALALAESLVACGRLDQRDLIDRFVRWWRQGEYSPTGACFDIGVATREALARYEASGDPRAGSDRADSAGNGSLMRLAPAAIWGLGAGEAAMRDAARGQSVTTHAAPACLDACESYALILRAAMLGAPFDQAAAAGAALDAEPAIAAILAGSWRDKPRAAIASSGYVAHSLEAALWCVARTASFRDAVLLAANLGDDADTTAAITGQLAGALYGKAGIPGDWLTKLAWAGRIEAAARALLTGAG